MGAMLLTSTLLAANPPRRGVCGRSGRPADPVSVDGETIS